MLMSSCPNNILSYDLKNILPLLCCSVGDLCHEVLTLLTASKTHARVGGGPHSRRHQTSDTNMSLASQVTQLLLLEMVHSEDIGGDHYNHWDVK